MMNQHLNLAMDGPVGAGKSSVADAVAARLGILHLDTGAMYRAVGLACIRAGLDMSDEEAVTACCEAIDIDVSLQKDGQHTFLNGEDVTGLIRTEEVSMAASRTSAYAGVRRKMVRNQQKLAENNDILLDGRDICTVVLPDAPVKIYLTASPEIRAGRRYRELQQKGSGESFEQVLADLKRRDDQDMNRKVTPLRPAEDAVIVDSSGMDFQQTVDAIIRIVEEKTHE